MLPRMPFPATVETGNHNGTSLVLVGKDRRAAAVGAGGALLFFLLGHFVLNRLLQIRFVSVRRRCWLGFHRRGRLGEYFRLRLGGGLYCRFRGVGILLRPGPPAVNKCSTNALIIANLTQKLLKKVCC